MFNFLKESHNIMGMAILFGLLLVVLFMLVMLLRKRTFGKSSKIVALIGMILAHLQFTIGLIVYFLSPLGMSNFSGESMGHPISRFYIVEHPIGMIIAVVLLTIGYSRSKKTHFSDAKRHTQVLVFYGIGLAIIAYLIPWFLWN